MQPIDVRASRETLHLLDVREPDEWAAGHIDGAQHIPLGELGDRIAEVPKGLTVLCVCRSGKRSELARRGLDQLGFSAENLEGGVDAWARAGLPLITTEGTRGRVL